MALAYNHKRDILVIASHKGVAIQCTPIWEEISP